MKKPLGAKELPLAEITEILKSGSFDQLLGGLEDQYLECKSAPYQLEHEREKMELAKDVSALANANGGIILIGIQTEEEPTHHGDLICRVRCFQRGVVDFTQCQKVIADWVLPSIPGLRFDWHQSKANPNEGIVSITVPQEARLERPFLVSKVVADSGRIVGSYVGFFERTRDNVTPTKAAELRERLKDGLRFSEIDARLANIEGMVGRFAAGPTEKKPGLSVETLLDRVRSAIRVIGYEGRPTLVLTAAPTEPVEFPDLFESHETPVVRLLENPPELRDAGFDLDTRRPSTIIEAELRRCTVPERKLVELWRDGPLICILAGDSSFLCWGMRSTPETGFRINNRALGESVYLFADLALRLYELSVPVPARLSFRLGLLRMTVEGKPASLSIYHPNAYNLGEGSAFAPGPNVEVEVEAERAAAEPGTIAYRLLARVYAWFGFNAEEMPYVNREVLPPRIDPEQLRSLS